jgi:ketosteroid isomerase-like protein
MTTPTEEYASTNAGLEANKAVVRAYYSAFQAGDRSRFAPYLHPDFFAIAPSYVPLGGRRHTAESFRDEVMPHLAKMLDFTRFKYESLVAEADQVIALVSIGIAGTDDSVLISEHWTVRDGKALSLLVLFFEPQKLLDSIHLAHGLKTFAH